MKKKSRDILDAEDWKKLISAILKAAMDDTIRLAHPVTRQKASLDEAYLDAVDMIWDPEYRMSAATNLDGDAYSILDILAASINNDLVELEKLQNFLAAQTMTYWDNKDVDTITIPDTVLIEGIPWRVIHAERESYEIDFDEHVIYLDRSRNDPEIQQLFMYAVTDITFDAIDIKLPRRDIRKLARALFRLLKTNNCFTGAVKPIQ
jgi:hypothetical protein